MIAGDLVATDFTGAVHLIGHFNGSRCSWLRRMLAAPRDGFVVVAVIDEK